MLFLPPASALARPNHSESWARDKFAAAEHLRQELSSRSANDGSRREYKKVIEAYRRVYRGCPTCTKADPSVVASAELLAQMGRQYDDDDVLHSAIKEYQFLRREYPGSKARVEALYQIGVIYKDELEDSTEARKVFEEVLRRYPHSRWSDNAAGRIAELDKSKQQETDKKPADVKILPATLSTELKKETNAPRKYTRVSGILHWITPGSARVAIDIDDVVEFKSERLEHPSRIYFDFPDTRLAAGLIGKTFDIEGELLKKIRVAQFERGRSRVVLEVDPRCDFRAYLLPNPNRVIVEIHAAGTKNNAPYPLEMAKQGSRPGNLPAITGQPGSAEPSSQSQVVSASESQPTFASPATTSIPRRIVEADDDDEEEASETPTARPAESRRGVEKMPSTSEAPAISNKQFRRKRKSADGNDDEVATLVPPEAKPETPTSAPYPPAALDQSTARTSAGRLGSRRDADRDIREAQPTMKGDRSLIRALGLKIGRIVIDPGHGGHDTGTIGPNGLEEKDVVLDVAKRLGKLLETRMGAEVVFTRQDDTFIPLETRTAIANREQADLFVSIHANSSRDEEARGVETYYLNFTSNAAALEVAARENAASDKSIHELQDLVKKIALKEKIGESREFAVDVQRSLHSGLGLKNPGIRDRGVKKAPFVVLIGANMPSILAEISFVSNPTDERKLDTAEYRQRVAESLYRGISKYVSGLSGVKVASRMAGSDDQ